ncbi:MAG TPA: nicotinamide-nucleotide amidohydrolase family protein [Opitutus sp.]|nr:nicotinamide-nucleotide amidohydrolase family protein [Opitutus sp.]
MNPRPAAIEELKALLLQTPRWTLAVAESLTAGRLQARVGEVSGASGFFLGGITAYSLEQKVKHLGVARVAAERVNSVSAEVAEQMAGGVCRLFGADLGVATTGYAEPAPAEGVMQPFAWWAIARSRGGTGGAFSVRHGRLECPGASRIETQRLVAEAVLAELLAGLRAWRATPA